MIWLILAIAIYLAVLFAVAWLSIHPYRIPFYLSPGSLGAPQEEVEFASSDGTRLQAWWIPAEGARTVALFVHGYMMNRCELVPEAHLLWRHGLSCLVMDLRCHGRSGGKQCSLGVHERRDVAAAVHFVRERVPDARVLLIGSSMGSAASALALADDPALADAIVLDSAYGRLDRAIMGWWRFLGGNLLAAVFCPMPLIGWPLTRVNPFRTDIAEALPRIGEKPALFFHGRCDNLALPSEAIRNFAAACGPKEIVWFEGCGHSEGRWEQPELYREALLAFLKEHGFVEEEGMVTGS